MFIIGNEHTATVTGTAVKGAACEACGTRYSYLATREGSGKGFAPYFLFESSAARSAQQKATADAQKQLARASDPVPCPSCGLVQPAMVRAARRRLYGWMADLGLGLLMLFGVATLFVAVVTYFNGAGWMIEVEAWAVYTTPGVLGSGLWFGRRALAARYDPNAASRADRIHEGRTRAVDWVTAGGRRGEEGESGWRW